MKCKGGRSKTERKKRLQRWAFRWNRCLLRLSKGWCPGRKEVAQRLALLYTDRDISGKLEDYYAAKTVRILKILGAGFLLILVLAVRANTRQTLSDGYFLPRKERIYTRELQLVTGEAQKEAFTLEVEPRALTKEEAIAALEEGLSQLEACILGENVSLSEVRSDLNLVQEISGTPVRVAWTLDSYTVMNPDGSLRQDKLSKEGSLVNLTASLTCGGQERVYRAAAKVFPPVLTEQEQWKQAVERAVEASQKESSGKTFWQLPDSIEGRSVSWEEERKTYLLPMLILTLVSAGAVYLAEDKELLKRTAEREFQLQRDYARIVTKLLLLIGAGLAVRNAWEMTVRDYQRKRESGQERFSYAYEEMALAVREMQNGVAETRAYENFGRRCRLPCYLKLSALLEQNLKKGSRGFAQSLNAEVLEAFEQRKSCAVKRGEEASTKLLLPMILMLAVVMLLILVPAGDRKSVV